MRSLLQEHTSPEHVRVGHRSRLRAAWVPRVAPALIFVLLAGILIGRGLWDRVFVPLDLVPHLHPWRFSYERVPVNNPITSDVVLQVYPRRVFANAMLRQGVLPLWNPTILTGTPLLADGQMTFFYPPSLLLIVLPLVQAFGYFAFAQVLLAAFGSYLAARLAGCGRGPATVAGVAYMFSGYLLTWLQFPHHSAAAAMLPWCIWAVARASARPSTGRWLVAAVALAMPPLVHIQIAFYTYVSAGLYVLVEALCARTMRRRLALVAGFAAACLLAFALCAVQLLPQIALSSGGQRLEQAANTFTPHAQFTSLLRLVLPEIGGQPRADSPAWGPATLAQPAPYAGLVPLALAICALMFSRRRTTTFFALLAIGSFALALGSPLLQLFILLFPPYRQFGAHERWLAVWGFAVPMLAGLGAQALLDRDAEQDAAAGRALWLNRALLGLTALFVLVWGLWHLQLFRPGSRYGLYITEIRRHSLTAPVLLGLASAAALAAAAIRQTPPLLARAGLVAVIAIDLLWYGGSFNIAVSPNIFKPTPDLTRAVPDAGAPDSGQPLYPLTQQITFLRRQPGIFRFSTGDYPVFLPNLGTAFGLEDVRGYQSLYLARYNRLVRLIDGKDYTRIAGEGSTSYKPYLTSAYKHRRLLDMLNVQYILFPPGSKNVPLYEPLELAHRSDEGTIYRNPRALPRAWLVHQVETLPTDDEQLARLARSDFDPAVMAIVPGAVPALGTPAGTEAVPRVSYRPNEVRIAATPVAPALLVLADAYDEGWQVTVDGKPAPLMRANYTLRGVWLPAGTHEVVMRYRPRSLFLGAGFSFAGVLIVLAGGVRNMRRPRGERARP